MRILDMEQLDIFNDTKPAVNKNYMSIGVSVRTTKSAARNNLGGVRQESNPQSELHIVKPLCTILKTAQHQDN
jgi:hypothetical protein